MHSVDVRASRIQKHKLPNETKRCNNSERTGWHSRCAASSAAPIPRPVPERSKCVKFEGESVRYLRSSAILGWKMLPAQSYTRRLQFLINLSKIMTTEDTSGAGCSDGEGLKHVCESLRTRHIDVIRSDLERCDGCVCLQISDTLVQVILPVLHVIQFNSKHTAFLGELFEV